MRSKNYITLFLSVFTNFSIYVVLLIQPLLCNLIRVCSFFSLDHTVHMHFNMSLHRHNFNSVNVYQAIQLKCKNHTLYYKMTVDLYFVLIHYNLYYIYLHT